MAARNLASGILTVVLCIGAGAAGYFGLFSGAPFAKIEGRITMSKDAIHTGETGEFIFTPAHETNNLLVIWEIHPGSRIIIQSPTNSNGNLKASIQFMETGTYKISVSIPAAGQQKWVISQNVLEVK